MFFQSYLLCKVSSLSFGDNSEPREPKVDSTKIMWQSSLMVHKVHNIIKQHQTNQD